MNLIHEAPLNRPNVVYLANTHIHTCQFIVIQIIFSRDFITTRFYFIDKYDILKGRRSLSVGVKLQFASIHFYFIQTTLINTYMYTVPHKSPGDRIGIGHASPHFETENVCFFFISRLQPATLLTSTIESIRFVIIMELLDSHHRKIYACIQNVCHTHTHTCIHDKFYAKLWFAMCELNQSN